MSYITKADIEARREIYDIRMEDLRKHALRVSPGKVSHETEQEYRDRRAAEYRETEVLRMRVDAAELHLRAALIMEGQPDIDDKEARRLAATLMSRTVLPE